MKAILMLDETPETCEHCRLRVSDCCRGKEIGHNLIEQPEKWDGTEEYTYKDKKCPLIEINDNIAHLIEVAR